MSRLPLSGKFDKPAAFIRNAGAPVGSSNYADYTNAHDSDNDYEDVIAFPALVSSSRNTITFQGGGNSEPYVMVVCHKKDDQAWVLAGLRVFNYTGSTPNDAITLPVGTVAVSIRRADGGNGAVGYILDLEI